MASRVSPAGAQIRRQAPAAIRRLNTPPGWVAALSDLDRRRSILGLGDDECAPVATLRSGLQAGDALDRGAFHGSPTPVERPAPAVGHKRFPRSVLLVEDNPGDIRLVSEAVASSQVHPRLTVAHDGLEALRMLQQEGKKPDLILLDLNLPALDGRALLRRIKTDPELHRIPTIVLTSSDARQDISGAYELHANCYMVKPTDFAGLERALHRLLEFWGMVVQLPSG